MSPFLFLSSNLELISSEVESLAKILLKEHDIDINSLFLLRDTAESIKIEEMRSFLSKGNEKPRFKFQIFLIENISRMTLQSANAALKFFEEPGYGNIIFLTNLSEADVLDTILSRVQVIRGESTSQKIIKQEYYDMIMNYSKSGDVDITLHFFRGKFEKQDYKDFLLALTQYIFDTGKYVHFLEELERDIQGLEKNNVNGKYLVDKYIGQL